MVAGMLTSRDSKKAMKSRCHLRLYTARRPARSGTERSEEIQRPRANAYVPPESAGPAWLAVWQGDAAAIARGSSRPRIGSLRLLAGVAFKTCHRDNPCSAFRVPQRLKQ
jgi:hypothetical protein